MKKKNIGIYGGAFDPIHIAHLSAAEASCKAGNFDKVWFMPTDVPAHKASTTPTYYRVKMTEIAIAPYPMFEINTLELELPKPSITINTIRELQRRYLGVQFHLIIGLDQAVTFDTWDDYEEILERVPLWIIGRPGCDWHELDAVVKLQRYSGKLQNRVDLDHDISSSAVREHLASRNHSDDIPDSVRQYILDHGLYKTG